MCALQLPAALLPLVVHAPLVASQERGSPQLEPSWTYVHAPGVAASGQASRWAVVTDEHGSVHAAGSVFSSGWTQDDDLHVVALDAAGDVLWEDVRNLHPAGADDQGIAAALDGLGHLYVLAEYESPDTLVLLKYDAAGTLVWQREWAGYTVVAAERHYLGVGPDGSPYLTANVIGSFGPGSTSKDVTVVRFDAEGEVVWEHLYVGGGFYASQLAWCMLVTADGGVVVGGESALSAASPPPDFLVYRLDPGGNLAWEHVIDTSQGGAARGLAAGADGSLYACGSLDLSAANDDGVVVKLAPDGQPVWTSTYHGGVTGAGSYDRFYDLQVAPDGSVYVTGEKGAYATAQYFDVLTARYDADGSLLWTHQVDAPHYTDDYGIRVRRTPDGNVVVLGTSKHMDGGAFVSALLLYSPGGELVWSEVGDVLSTPYFHAGIDVGPDGDVYAAGSSIGGPDGWPWQHFAVTKYDYSGVAAAVDEREPCWGQAIPGGIAASAPPILGSTFEVALDDPGDSAGLSPGSLAQWFVTAEAGLLYPCGPLVAGWGPGATTGEILVDPTLASSVHASAVVPWSGPGTPALVSATIPTVPTLAGLALFGQAVFVDPASGEVALTPALDLVLGV